MECQGPSIGELDAVETFRPELAECAKSHGRRLDFPPKDRGLRLWTNSAESWTEVFVVHRECEKSDSVLFLTQRTRGLVVDRSLN